MGCVPSGLLLKLLCPLHLFIFQEIYKFEISAGYSRHGFFRLNLSKVSPRNLIKISEKRRNWAKTANIAVCLPNFTHTKRRKFVLSNWVRNGAEVCKFSLFCTILFISIHFHYFIFDSVLFSQRRISVNPIRTFGILSPPNVLLYGEENFQKCLHFFFAQ